MKPTVADWHTSHFKDRVDPDDGNFRRVELKLPHDAQGNPNYGPFQYTGSAARERIRRFCAAFLSVTGEISQREAEKILRKSRATDERSS